MSNNPDDQPKMVTLQGADGTSYELQLLDILEFEGQEYGVLVQPASASQSEKMVLMRLIQRDSGPVFQTIESDAEFERVTAHLQTLADAAGNRDKPTPAEEWSQIGSFSEHDDSVRCVAFSPDGQKLVTVSTDRTLNLWDLAGKQLVFKIAPKIGDLYSVAYSRDGSRIAAGGYGRIAKVWDAATGEELASLEGHGGDICAVAFSPDGALLATGSGDYKIGLWNLSGGGVSALAGHDLTVWCLAFSPDGAWLATGGGEGTVKLWNVVTRAEVIPLDGHTQRVTGVRFSPDGRLVASASHDRTAKIWDVATGELIETLPHERGVEALDFRPISHQLATAANGVRIWDIATSRPLSTLAGGRSVAFSPNGMRLAVAVGDSVELWQSTPAPQ